MNKQKRTQEFELLQNSDVSSRVSSNVPESNTENRNRLQSLKYHIRNYMIVECAVFIFMFLFLLVFYELFSQSKTILEFRTEMDSRMTNIENRSRPQSSFKNDIPAQYQTYIETRYKINAAKFQYGATVDSSRSSYSNLSPFMGLWDQSSLVLIDRLFPPENKLWCTKEKNPVLTINLVTYITPKMVTYQHSKWNGVIPNGAPKKYSVWACLDYYCKDTQLLVHKCEYNHQQQVCHIPSESNSPSLFPNPSVVKVQFRFHENHGNVDETCIGLVQVYGDSRTSSSEHEIIKKDITKCSILKSYFYDHPILYSLSDKSCMDLYSMKCCDECPECCLECKIDDSILRALVTGIIGIIILTIFLVVVFLVIKTYCFNQKRTANQNRQSSQKTIETLSLESGLIVNSDVSL